MIKLSGFSFFADFSKSAKSANLLFAESAKISKSAKVATLMKPIFLVKIK
jgi:hypothetical protein